MSNVTCPSHLRPRVAAGSRLALVPVFDPLADRCVARRAGVVVLDRDRPTVGRQLGFRRAERLAIHLDDADRVAAVDSPAGVGLPGRLAVDEEGRLAAVERRLQRHRDRLAVAAEDVVGDTVP